MIQALDVGNIYDVPVAYHREGLDSEVLAAFGMEAPMPDLRRWTEISERIAEPGRRRQCGGGRQIYRHEGRL